MEDKPNLNPNKNTILYLDANNMFHRAYHASSVNNGNHLHYFLNMVYALKMSVKHLYAFAIFDGENSRKSREEIYPEYKQNRTELKDKDGNKIDLKPIMKMSEEILEHLGFNVYSSQNIEGDDVIGILARKSLDKGLNVVVVSSDKDYKQLCQYSPYLNIYNTQHKIITHQENFEEKNGIPCQYYVDYLSLIGDNSDGIESVSKVGKVTAQKWINAIGGIKEIKENLDKIKDGKVKDNLIEAINNGVLDRNYRLIGFMFDKENEIKIDKTKLIKSDINIEKLDEFCINHNMKQFREKNIEPMIQNNYYARPKRLYEILQNGNIKSTKNQTEEQVLYHDNMTDKTKDIESNKNKREIGYKKLF